MDLVAGVEELRPEHGPVFAVVGVFDGLHRGHLYLLDHLAREAGARSARATVITFDHHPDEVITGTAPPLLMDPQERLERLAAAGVELTVVQHFDEAVRHTTYQAFIGMIRSRTPFAGLLMTPDAAFGYERRGTPDALAALGAEQGFDVVVVPPFTLDGRSVRSSDVRAALAAGKLRTAEELLGRAVTISAQAAPVVEGVGTPLAFAWPVALPPPGMYRCRVGAAEGTLRIEDGSVLLESIAVPPGRTRVELLAS
ncbi:MAG: FAD synthetase family protein [Chloroflexota bacterium]